MKKFRYILRYYIDPGFHEDERIAELIDFCRQAAIDEVMLFFNAEEMNTGHWQLQELYQWLPLAKKIKAALAQIGVDISLNPWTTLVHDGRGRRLKPDQDYTLMIGDSGCDNGVTVCPMDENWLHDLCGLWQCAVRELQPVAMWIEDDFRYHNHSAILGFGGCYCDRHLAEFAKIVGKPVSRDELLQKLFAPGKAHPWRRLWMKMCGRVMNESGRKLASAVAAAAPGIRIGLMSGTFDSMSADGRDLSCLQQCLEPEIPLAFRPTMSPYTEVWAMRRAPVEARMTASMLKEPFLLYPELESGPRHGAYSLGCGFAGWEIMESASFGSQGITINCFDMMGNGTVIDLNFGAMLGALKPRLDALTQLGISDRRACGAKVLISPDIAMHASAHCNRYQCYSGEWGRVATILGISHRFVSEISDGDEPYLVSGQVLRAFAPNEVKRLLSKNIILDAVAAADVIEMGLGSMIGTETVIRHDTTADDCSFEEILCNDPEIYGVAYPRLTAQRAAWELSEFATMPDAEILSCICSSAKKRLFPGSFRFDNDHGGRIITLAYDMGDRGREEWFYFGFFNIFRRIFIQKMLLTLAPDADGAYVNSPARCFCSLLPDGGRFISVLNSTTDRLDGVEIFLTGSINGTIRRLDADANWTESGFTVKKVSGGTLLKLQDKLDIHGAEFFRSDKY